MTAVHGGPDAAGVPLHDFSTNSNACGPCPEALRTVQAADATRYPDPAYTALRGNLGALHGVGVERIVLAASASEFIHRITALAVQHGPVRVGLPAHSYGDYAQAAAARGLAVERGDASAVGLQWACEPSSPQGLADPRLQRWREEKNDDAQQNDDPGRSHAGRSGDAGTARPLRVLDCAYAPLRLDAAGAWTGKPHPLPAACWQLWTPNKALGLTGVRAAYAVAPAGAEEKLRLLAALAPSWPVGAHGVALLHAWTQPTVQQWLVHSLATLREWKARQLALCADLGWVEQGGSLANYFCATPRGPGLPAELPRRLAGLRAAGIKLRDCASFGLPGQVRLGVLPPESQDALCAAWRALRPISL